MLQILYCHAVQEENPAQARLHDCGIAMPAVGLSYRGFISGLIFGEAARLATLVDWPERACTVYDDAIRQTVFFTSLRLKAAHAYVAHLLIMAQPVIVDQVLLHRGVKPHNNASQTQN